MATKKTSAKSEPKVEKNAAETSAPVDFESALAQLETLVEKLEAGDISLEESLRAFEEGVQLTRSCQRQLAAAEQRVQVLVKQQNEYVLEDFALDDDDAD
jgi:exodeoxyribonuclease VII small subunit